MQLFYAPEITSEKIYLLPEEESSHCIAVLRYKEGQDITITDGKGSIFFAVIVRMAKKQVTVEIKEAQKISNPRSYHLHIAIAPTKNIERFEWFLEKTTEIGIDEITPLITENSERRVIRADRLEKIMIAAMKQSLKAFLPRLNPICNFHDFMNAVHQDRRFIAHCFKDARILLQNAYSPGTDATIMIGPEGDFTPNEIQQAMEKGFTSISLGDSRLRTETAGIVACHTLYIQNQGRD
jgi:16S rRNA (uracil1498-N3)-methyltransferase